MALWWVLLAAASGCSADKLVLGANREALGAGGARRQVVKVAGRVVECWIVRSPGGAAREPEAFVLFLVGKADRAERWVGAVAGAWGGRPVEVWGMNYPGSGGSEGPAQLTRVVPAALGVYDAMAQESGGRPVFLHAGSFGTSVALAVAARRPAAGMVPQNPAPLRPLILGRYGWWNLWLVAGPVAAQIPAELDSVANAGRATAPTVFILHGADRTIPPRYQRLVVDAYAGPKQIIDVPGAGHNAPLPREATDQLAAGLDWLWQGGRNFPRRP